jgi:hypothetical protein
MTPTEKLAYKLRNGHQLTQAEQNQILAALRASTDRALTGPSAETIGYVAAMKDGNADWSSLMITDDEPDILLSPGYRWTPCAVRLLTGTSEPTIASLPPREEWEPWQEHLFELVYADAVRVTGDQPRSIAIANAALLTASQTSGMHMHSEEK